MDVEKKATYQWCVAMWQMMLRIPARATTNQIFPQAFEKYSLYYGINQKKNFALWTGQRNRDLHPGPINSWSDLNSDVNSEIRNYFDQVKKLDAVRLWPVFTFRQEPRGLIQVTRLFSFCIFQSWIRALRSFSYLLSSWAKWFRSGASCSVVPFVHWRSIKQDQVDYVFP